MKKIVSIVFILSILAIANAGLQTINIYSPLGTNTNPMNGTISIPGVITNAPFTIVSNQITGDPQSLAWTKANNNWAFQSAQIQSNANAIASGLGYGGTNGGTNVLIGNYIATTNGTGSDLTITNSLTLIDPTPYYGIVTFNPGQIDALSNWNDGYFPADSLAATLTNDAGYSAINLYPATGTNIGGVYSLATNLTFPVLTNSSGWIAITNFTATNNSGPFYFATEQTNANGDWLSNSSGFAVFTGGICPNQNGPYIAAPQYGPNTMTNRCGDTMYMALALTNLTNFYATVSSITVTAWPPFSLTYTNFNTGNLSSIYIASPLGEYTYWMVQSGSYWERFSATNVTFSLPQTIHITGNYDTNSPYTNFWFTASPTNGQVFNGDPNELVTFYTTNIGFMYLVNGDGIRISSIPSPGDILFIITTSPPATNSAPPIVPVNPSPRSECTSYIIADIGGVTKYWDHGMGYWSLVHELNWASGSLIFPSPNYLSIDAAGNATVHLFGAPVLLFPWSDPAWVTMGTTEGVLTNIPPDACSLTPIGLPLIAE